MLLSCVDKITYTIRKLPNDWVAYLIGQDEFPMFQLSIPRRCSAALRKNSQDSTVQRKWYNIYDGIIYEVIHSRLLWSANFLAVIFVLTSDSHREVQSSGIRDPTSIAIINAEWRAMRKNIICVLLRRSLHVQCHVKCCYSCTITNPATAKSALLFLHFNVF